MIKLTNLQKIYRTKEIETVALENVNLEVQQGEFLSIMGPSGCGTQKQTVHPVPAKAHTDSYTQQNHTKDDGTGSYDGRTTQIGRASCRERV